MQHEDELLSFFAEEEISRFQQYATRMSIQQYQALTPKRLKDQYYSLTKSHKIIRKQAETEKGKTQIDQDHEIPQIYGNRMKSIVDRQVYAIFCDAPDRFSVQHFWPACYREKVSKIYMILPNSEKYWPALNDQIVNQEQKLTIRCVKEQTIKQYLIKRDIVICGPEGERLVEHYHYRVWPDGSIPATEEHCEVFRQLVQGSIKAIDNQEIILIHCRAGIGRTGTMGATIQAVRCARHQKTLSLFEITANMRAFRDFCVQTPDQYRFAHEQSCKLLS